MEYFTRLKNFWFPDLNALWWLLLCLPAIYFFHTLIHEGSHAVSAAAVSGNFPKLAPFPHQNASGNFLNGVTLGDPSTVVTVTERTRCDSDISSPQRRLAGFIATPQFVALAIILIISLITAFAGFSSATIRFLLRMWFLAACLDFMYNSARGLIGGCNISADWSRFMVWYDINPALFAVMTWFFWLAILSHFAWVYWSAWGKEAPSASSFWDYKIVSAIMGSLSLIAIIWSLAVSDPAIDKSSAAFIVLLLLQISAFAWYWIYFGISFKYGD